MHIPQSPICDAMIEPFSAALAEEVQASVTYDKEKWIYLPCTYREYRYLLGTRGKNPLICIGINPSTAAPDDLDNTLKSVDRIARGNGYDSFLMFNVYAQRATNPDDMDKERNLLLHTENMAAFRYVLSSYGEGHTPAVWAAWGTIIEKRPYLLPTLADMITIGKEFGTVWYSVGKCSKRGHPHHPLYLRKDASVEAFDVLSYLASLT